MPLVQPISLAAIKNKEKYLFTYRQDQYNRKYNNKWQIPGGAVEFGETPISALHREVQEELGVDVNVLSPYPYTYIEVREQWQGVLLCFLCTMKNSKDSITLNSEAMKYEWMSLNELHNSDTMPGTIDMIEHMLKIASKYADN